MSVYREKSRSAWMEVAPEKYPTLAEDITADVVIIGSGIAGLSTAYELAKRGKGVVVIDRGPVARGMTARTSAHLTSSLDDFYHEFISLRGEETAKLHFESQAAAIDRIETIQREEKIACDFARLTAYMFLAGETEAKALHDEQAALDTVGLRGSKVVSRPDVSHHLSNRLCLVIPGQGRFHPLRYLDGLAEVCIALGVDIFADTIVTKIEDTTDGVSVETSGGPRVAAGAAVVATNTPINDRLTIHAKQAPYRTYVFAAAIPDDAVDDALYWDTEDPYHYVRLHPFDDETLLLVGGEDHKSGVDEGVSAETRFGRLERWARERFPELGDIRYRWSGQVMDTIDYAAFIGLNPGNRRVYVATGDSGQGITHGVAASLMLPDLIDSGTHRWADVFSPSRKPLAATTHLLSDTVDVAKNMAERFMPGEHSSVNGLGPGQGAVIRDGIHLVAVCRDEQGDIHRHSASCTHTGCVIHWNAFEQCWDCPCHGSQFAPDGTALNAPAIQPLSSADGDVKVSQTRRPEAAAVS
ncbi:MAG TPA: FAD-dependent oxidoreductase [Bauldia sp.]|nr:FAD-dependent oxidoreductase [Bauldia sp.]